MLGAGLPAARHLRDGNLSVPALEDYLRRIFVKHRFRQKHPSRRVVVPIVEELSLALDIDTEEEARAAADSVATLGDLNPRVREVPGP